MMARKCFIGFKMRCLIEPVPYKVIKMMISCTSFSATGKLTEE
jgi:hypothetical protein